LALFGGEKAKVSNYNKKESQMNEAAQNVARQNVGGTTNSMADESSLVVHLQKETGE